MTAVMSEAVRDQRCECAQSYSFEHLRSEHAREVPVSDSASLGEVLAGLTREMTGKDLPGPRSLTWSEGNEIIWFRLSDVRKFEQWRAAFDAIPVSRQPYDDNGTASVLLSSHGFFMGWWVALSCLVPAVAC